MEARTIYEILNARLEALRRAYHGEEMTRGAYLVATYAIFGLSIIVVAEELFWLPPLTRTLLVAICGAAFLSIVAWRIVVPLLRIQRIMRTWNRDEAARYVGSHLPKVSDRLVDALQVYEESRRTSIYSSELSETSLVKFWEDFVVQAKAEGLSGSSGELSFEKLIDRKPKQAARRLFLAGIVIAALLFLPAPMHFVDALHRIVHFTERFARPSPYQFLVTPGTKEVLKGSDVPIMIRVIGPGVRNIVLHLARTAEDQERISLSSDSSNIFRTVLRSLRMTTTYTAEVQGYRSDEYKLIVVDRPLVKSLRVLLTPPSYTHLAAHYLEDNVGDIEALAGTNATIEVISNKELAQALISFGDSTKVPMSISGVQAVGSFQVRGNGAYVVSLQDTSKLTNSDPIVYRITVLPDEFPTVEITQPGRNADLGEDMKLPLLLSIRDDFGFTKLRIGYRLVHSKYEKPRQADSYVEVPLPSGQGSELKIPFIWDLSKLNLVPEDALQYHAEVFDNDAVSGPKLGRSESFVVRVPSLDEIFAQVEEEHKDISKTLEVSKEEAEKLHQSLQEVQQEFLKTQKLDWQNQKKIENIGKRYEELRKNLQQTAENLNQLIQNMNQNKLLSPETLEKYMELQELMNQLNSPELQQVLKKLQEAMRNLNPDLFREAMKNLAFSEEAFRQSIERTLSLLKRIQIEQKIDELRKRAEELRKAQEELHKSAEQVNPSDAAKLNELADKQGDLQSQLSSVEKELKQLKSRMEEFPNEMPLQQLTRAMQQLSTQQLSSKMHQVQRQLQAGELQQAQQIQQQIAQGLSDFQSAMEQVQKALQENQQREIVNQLRKATNDLLTLSQQQERLKNETRSFEPNSQRFREAGEEQAKVIENVGNVIGHLIQLSQKTFAVTPEMGRELGKALMQMNQAMSGLESRNGGFASSQQEGAMASLNRTASLLEQSLQSMLQGSGAGGLQSLLSQLQQLASQQMGINAMTQQIQQQGMSLEQQAQMARLAAQQAAVQKSLEQLAEEARRAGQREKLLGDLEKIAEEMKEVVKDLENKNIASETLKRQDRILSRLLDASRSVHERDFEKRRVAEAGENVQRQSPPELNLENTLNRLQQDILKAREEGYSRDYQDLIRRYYEAIQNLGVKVQ